MKNKLLTGVLAISCLLGTIVVTNLNHNRGDMIESTIDIQNEVANIKKINAKGAIVGDEELDYSKTFVQHAKDEETGDYYLRFATAIKGSIESAYYTRTVLNSDIEDNTLEVTTVYRSLLADGKHVYYDGASGAISEDSSLAGQYYWACYTVKFGEESINKAKDLKLSLKINDEVVSERTSSLYDSIVSEYETLTEEFNVMSFNVRVETSSDTGNTHWDVRKSHLMNWVLESNMDVVCFQEVKFYQYIDLRDGLSSKYDLVCYERETDSSGNNPECVVIAYDNTFELIDQNMFWLSATPNKLSKDWGTYVDEEGNTKDYEDDEYYRICVNALLRSNKGVYLDVYNVHLGLTNDSRTLAAKLISERMAESKYPSVVMGDFNCQLGTDPYNTFAETLQDCQQVAEITEKEGIESYTFNGWKSPSSTIDFIFASEDITPMTFDVNQEKWDGNYYSDHFAVDTSVKVSYTREVLRTVKSIDFNGDVTIVNDNGRNVLDAEVVATFKDGTTEVLPHDYYTIDLLDDYNFGDTPTEVVATLNGMEDIKVSKMPIVKDRYQVEYGTYTGAKREFRQKYKINNTGNLVVTNSNEIYCHLGAFDDAVLNGKEGSFSINVNSTSNAVGDISSNMSNIDFIDVAGKANDATRFSAAPMRLNKIMNLYVNGELTSIPDDAVLGYAGYANTDWSGMYHVLQDVVIRNISLKEGNNVIKFQFKKHADGDKEQKWNKVIATSNVNYADFITKESNLSSEQILTGLEILNDEIYQVGDVIANEVKVNAVYSNGFRKTLTSSDYTISLLQNDVAVEGTTFVAGNYTLKVTYNNDTSIVATKEISAVTYSASYKSSRIYQSGDRVYFELVFNSVGYKPEDFAIFHYSREIKMTGTYANGLCTLVGDITVNGTPNMFTAIFMSHALLLKDGVSHMFGSKTYGDIINGTSSGTFSVSKSITVNGYTYKYGKIWAMPSIQVVKV